MTLHLLYTLHKSTTSTTYYSLIQECVGVYMVQYNIMNSLNTIKLQQ